MKIDFETIFNECVKIARMSFYSANLNELMSRIVIHILISNSLTYSWPFVDFPSLSIVYIFYLAEFFYPNPYLIFIAFFRTFIQQT